MRRATRRYSSALRSEQADLTRQRIIDAAATLFIHRGYTATTIAEVARTANISAETVYAVFDGKRGILEGVIDARIMGVGAPIALEEQPAWDAIAREPTPSARLRAYVEFTCGVLARTSDVHHVIRGAASAEPFAVTLSDRLLRERLASNTKHLRDYVGDALRDGLSLRRAAERFCALTSPEHYHFVTARLGWSAQTYQDWIASVVEHDLLGAP